MPIDKITPKYLSSDSDNKLVPKNAMLDALNVYLGSDDTNSDLSGGDGVLKNIRGTLGVSDYSDTEKFPSTGRVLGSVEDTKTKILYLFVWSPTAAKQGVWAYDSKGVLPDSEPGDLRLIYKSAQFNFPDDGFVKGDVVYSNAVRTFAGTNDDLDKDAILYFTDGKNEPRKINAYRAFAAGGSSIHDAGDVFAEADFITACPKVPLVPITFAFNRDPNKLTSNFSTSPGFQFAYQSLYVDGMDSAISPYSDIAFPPSVLGQGAQTHVDHSPYNRCVLTIPTVGPETKKVRLLARQGNTGSLLIIDEIIPEDFVNADNGFVEYGFYNDRILTGVSTDEVNKQFDSVPRKAKAQSVSSNRLAYGNYLDGFDNIDVKCQSTVKYKERPEDFLSFNIKATLAVSGIIAPHIPGLTGGGSVSPNSRGAALSTPNVLLDFSEMPNEIKAGTEISFDLSLTPKKNWHFSAGLPQTRQQGPQYDSGVSDVNVYDGVNAAQSLALENEGSELNFAVIGQAGAAPYTSSPANLENYGGKFFARADSFSGDPIPNGVISVNPYNDAHWNRKITPVLSNAVWPDEVQEARFGSQAQSPFILKGAPVDFSVKIIATQDIVEARHAIKECITRGISRGMLEPGHKFYSIISTTDTNAESVYLGFELVSNNTLAEYDIDTSTNSGDLIPQPYIGQDGASDFRASLIVGVHTPSVEGSYYKAPAGYFFVNKATPRFRLHRRVSVEGNIPNDWNLDETEKSLVELRLLDLSVDEDNGLYTCIHQTSSSNTVAHSTNWIAISRADIDAIANDDPSAENNYPSIALWGAAHNLWGLTEASFVQSPLTDGPSAITEGYGNQLGYLTSLNGDLGAALITRPADEVPSSSNWSPDYTNVAELGGPEMTSFDNAWANRYFPDNEPYVWWQQTRGLMDGEGGPGGGPSKHAGSTGNHYDQLKLYNQGSVTVNPLVIQPDEDNPTEYFHYEGTVFYGGQSFLNNFVVYSFGSDDPDVNWNPPSPRATTLPFLFWDGLGNTSYDYLIPEEHETTPGNLASSSVSFKAMQSPVDISSINTSIASSTNDNGSFKTDANHEFGIIYYDERGRHGFVNPLPSVFVKGYSNDNRGLGDFGKGKAEIELGPITSSPPSWAHTYKVAYAKNSTVQDFVQYSAGGAFVVDAYQNLDNDGFNRNIYVSLNHLQGHPISYVSSFGARTPEGGLNFYKFQEGDKLKVISYFEADYRKYVSYEFEVVGVVNLGGAESNNPLSVAPTNNQQGEFVILKDNDNASNFSFVDVSAGSDKWGSNCIIELRTPKKTIDPDQQIYYEIGDSYRVVLDSNSASETFQEPIHEGNPTHTLSNGDVWFRPVAVNARELEDDGSYIDLIVDTDDDDVPSISNFKTVYLESLTASDLFRADSISIGRPNVVFGDSEETVREATITYSDPSNPESNRIKYSSFNSSLANFKDLPEAYKGIDYISDQDGYLFVAQGNKSGLIPVNKNILSDVSGSQNVVASRNILGEATFYPGRTGSDGNPESVTMSNDSIFFANKSLGKIYRFNRSSGIEVISDIEMAATLRKAFKEADAETGADQYLRVVGGYDPVKEEYLITILGGSSRISATGVVLVNQPSAEVIVPGDLTDDENDDTTTFEMVQDAIDYINEQAGSADPADHMTGVQFRELTAMMQSLNSSANAIIFDGADGDGAIGQADGDLLTSAFGQTYNIDQSVYIAPATDANRAAQIPLPKIMPPWKTTQQALDYIHSIGTMNIEEFLYFRSFLRDQVVMSTSGSSVSITDLLQFLAVFGTLPGETYGNPQDSAYVPSFTGGGGAFTYSVMTALNFIIQQGDMTASQYTAWQNAGSLEGNASNSIILGSCRMDGTEDKQVTVADFMIFLSVFSQGDTVGMIDPDSSAFNF